MRVTFWGTRGSIATPGPSTTIYGGNTSCVEVRCGSDILTLAAGTGIRPLGQALVDEFQERPFTVHLFLSHTHWDPIQGFPFFMPAYQPTATIHIYGSTGLGRPLEKLMRGQMDPDYFPVALGELASTLLVHELRGTTVEIRDVTITTAYLNHPGMNLGYRVAHGGKTLVYATDNEPYRVTLDRLGLRGSAGRDFGRRLDEEFIRFVEGADRKSTRLNSSHSQISYAVFCLKKKNSTQYTPIAPSSLDRGMIDIRGRCSPVSFDSSCGWRDTIRVTCVGSTPPRTAQTTVTND